MNERTMIDFGTLRAVAEAKREITENYNMGFLNQKEMFCQLADTYTWVNGERWKWHLLCLLPKWMFRLYERVR